MNTNWILMSSKNPKMKNKRPRELVMMLQLLLWVFYIWITALWFMSKLTKFHFFHHQIKDFCYFFYDLNPLILFSLFTSILQQIKAQRLKLSQTSTTWLES